MGDFRIVSKNFNPYDLGSVAKVMNEFRRPVYRAIREVPYIPPHAKNEEGPQQETANEETPTTTGNYTEERRQRYSDQGLDDLLTEIRRGKKNPR